MLYTGVMATENYRPKAIIFDCWNTLYSSNIGLSMQNIAHRFVHRPFNHRYVKTFEKSFMLAEYKNLEDPARDFLRRFRIPAFRPVVKRLADQLDDSLERQQAFDDTHRTLLRLRKDGYKLALITNSWEQAFEHLDKKYKVRDHFDVVITSYETGLMKPDPKIFKLALDKLDVLAGDAVMVGDSLPDDFRASRAAGLHAVLIDRWGRYPKFQPKISSLKEIDAALGRL